MKRNNRQHGFAIIFVLILSPIILSCTLAAYTAISFMMTNQEYTYTCRSRGIATQTRVSALLSQLIKLNPKATTLRTQKKLAEYRQSIAIKSGNPIAIATTTNQLMVIQAKIAALDLNQKQLIAVANIDLRKSQASTQWALQKITQNLPGIGPFKSSLKLAPNSRPTLAVIPSDTDLAPNYNPHRDFENRQALVQKWQIQIKTQGFLRNFIPGAYTFQKSCSVTLTKDGNKWVSKIQKDRFF